MGRKLIHNDEANEGEGTYSSLSGREADSKMTVDLSEYALMNLYFSDLVGFVTSRRKSSNKKK